ncbi:hypothetical protein [Nesterenkonia sphaerica]|uniref:DUF4760 domain-containing protein n=1 Tax=Nesterenkonia sphaerica TaxID=1804988 RepID=A0A5R8ZWE2_9MICC|nr:hypothetical protein [Nesterenkonia sphaerica]TLP70580.1 hypothetical protein FEF27_12950 [Nesterenkonia sphaerica]
MSTSSEDRSLSGESLGWLSWVATIGGVVAFIVMAASESARKFYESYYLGGWSLAFLLVIMGPCFVRSLARRKTASLKNQLQDRIEDLSREDWRRDLGLLQERMAGWELDSNFHVYLVEHVDHKRLPDQFVRQLEHQIRRWNRDSRELWDPEVAKVWTRCRDAAEAYDEWITFYMFSDDSNSALHVAPEWSSTDPERYREAFEVLGKAARELAEALAGVYRVQHAPGAPRS